MKDTASFYTALVSEIISEQEIIIGSLAWDQAKKVPGLRIVEKSKIIFTEKEPKAIVEQLVRQYAFLFGKASIHTCRLAAERVLREYSMDVSNLPHSLQTV